MSDDVSAPVERAPEPAMSAEEIDIIDWAGGRAHGAGKPHDPAPFHSAARNAAWQRGWREAEQRARQQVGGEV